MHKIRNFHEGHSTFGEWQGSGRGKAGLCPWDNRGKANSCPPYIKICKKCQALQYCDEFIELTVGTSRVWMSKAATNSICSNKQSMYNVNIHM
jgi:hypothetical protein